MSGFHANLLPHKLHDVLRENTLRGNVECVHTDSKPTDRNHAVHVHLTTEQPNQSSSGKNINTTDGTVLQKKKLIWTVQYKSKVLSLFLWQIS